MRTDPRMLLRGIGKFVAVVLAAGLAGAGIGIALAKLSGNDGSSDPILPATTTRISTSTGRTQKPATRTSTSPARSSTSTSPARSRTTTASRTSTSPTRTSTTPAGGTSTSANTTKAVYRIPRVQVRSALLGSPSEETGRALVTLRVRVTNRGNRALTIKNLALLSVDDVVPLGSGDRDAAGALVRPIEPGATASGVLRFTVPSAIAQRLAANPGARLRVANRVVVVKLTTSQPTG